MYDTRPGGGNLCASYDILRSFLNIYAEPRNPTTHSGTPIAMKMQYSIAQNANANVSSTALDIPFERMQRPPNNEKAQHRTASAIKTLPKTAINLFIVKLQSRMSKYERQSLRNLLEDCSFKRTKALYAAIDKKARLHPCQSLSTLSFNHTTLGHMAHKNGVVLADTLRYLLRHPAVRKKIRTPGFVRWIGFAQLYKMMALTEFCDTDVMVEYFMCVDRFSSNGIGRRIGILQKMHVDAFAIALEKSSDRTLLFCLEISGKTGISDRIAEWIIAPESITKYTVQEAESKSTTLKCAKLYDHQGLLLLRYEFYEALRCDFVGATTELDYFQKFSADQDPLLGKKISEVRSLVPSYSSFEMSQKRDPSLTAYQKQLLAMHKCAQSLEGSFKKLDVAKSKVYYNLRSKIFTRAQQISAMHGVYFYRVYILMQAFSSNAVQYSEMSINTIVEMAEPGILAQFGDSATKRLYLAAQSRFLAKVRAVGQSDATHDNEKQSTKRRKVKH